MDKQNEYIHTLHVYPNWEQYNTILMLNTWLPEVKSPVFHKVALIC